jgi:hypothetical protein
MSPRPRLQKPFTHILLYCLQDHREVDPALCFKLSQPKECDLMQLYRDIRKLIG